MVIAEGAPPPGTVIAEKYRVLGVIGSGGMGCLVKAEHLLLKKEVAIKFVLADRSKSTRRRLFREARAAQALSCEQVVRVFDLGVHAEAPYIVMELLEGDDLSVRLRAGGPLPIQEAVDCILEACVAIAEAHARGIVHRDLKPSNLFAARTATREVVKVLDFGISKVPELAGSEDCEQTAAGMLLGTPHYMSPEQLRNPSNIDGRADIWALGVTLFQLLSGEHPFPGANAREITAAIFSDPPRSLLELRADVTPELSQVVLAALAKRPEQRTESVDILVRDLLPFASKRGQRAAEQVLGGEAPAARREPPPLAVAVPMSTTDEGLSAPLSASDAEVGPAASGSRPSGRAALLAVGLAAAVSATLFWLARETPSTSVVAAPATPPSIERPVEPAPHPNETPSAEVTVAPPAPAPASPIDTGSAQTTATSRVAMPVRQPPAKLPKPISSEPPAVPSAPAPRDIDGVPIFH